MKYLIIICLSAIGFWGCVQSRQIDHFSGVWVIISSNVNGDKTMPKDTMHGTLKSVDKHKNQYFMYFFGIQRFDFDRIDENHLIGHVGTIEFLKNGHIVFDMGNGYDKGAYGGTGRSIFELKKLN